MQGYWNYNISMLDFIKLILLNVLPFFLVKHMFGAMPPTCAFRTTTGRTFRLIRVTNDFCLAISSEKYDPAVVKKLVGMKKRGEQLIDTAIEGLNLLSIDNRDNALRNFSNKGKEMIDDDFSERE